jgi:inositol transporter-like SP family MFS transporter
LANYIDGGSIVAGSAALALWTEEYQLSPRFLGLLAAFSANAIGAATGALFGGFLCDRYGRKTIYQYDMLFYAFGMLWLVFAVRPWMIGLGVVLVGLAVGADIPASWSLIAEQAPQGKRGAHSGLAQALWLLGPLVVLLLAFGLSPFGLTGIRLIFAHLVVLALALTVFRSRMKESAIWVSANQSAKPKSGTSIFRNQVRALFTPRHLRSVAFLVGMYGIWNLCSGTLGFFLPYILRTVGGQSQLAAMGFQASAMTISLLCLVFIFMKLVDRVDQRLLLGLSVLIQAIGISLLAIFPLTKTLVVIFLLILALSGFGSPQAFYQLWSAELFPTLLRGTAQGITFAAVRIAMGIWSLYVPLLAFANFHALIWILTAFLVVGGLIGVIWAPRNQGRSLHQIERSHL